MVTRGTVNGWDTWELGSSDAAHTVLMLPGALCSGEAMVDLMEQPALADTRRVAVTVGGWAGTAPLEDVSVESYARACAKVAADIGADVIVGHSYGANLALEAAALGAFSGPIVLLSPSFSREDEVKFLAVLNGIGKVPVLGPAVWWVAMKGVPGSLKKEVPEARRDVLVAELSKNVSSVCRANTRKYYEYLDHHQNLVPRLCDSGVKSWTVFGTDDEIGLKDEERAGLEACANAKLMTVTGTHMFPVANPSETAGVVAEAVAAAG